MEFLKHIATDWGIHLDALHFQTFERYYDELIAWNRRMNLTTITAYEAVQVRHFADSLAVLLVVGDLGAEGVRLIDIGSGAGFPGLPLKIVNPAWQVTLVEATRKKTAFLEHLVAVLGLEGVEVVWARAEELGRDPRYREQFDLATARAVAELAVLVEYALPLVRVGGRFVAQKGAEVAEELEHARGAIELLGGAHVDTVPYVLPRVDGPLHLVVIEKVAPTPAQYPRRPGMPGKRPLGRTKSNSKGSKKSITAQRGPQMRDDPRDEHRRRDENQDWELPVDPRPEQSAEEKGVEEEGHGEHDGIDGMVTG